MKKSLAITVLLLGWSGVAHAQFSSLSSPVSSVFNRTGAIVATKNDYTPMQLSQSQTGCGTMASSTELDCQHINGFSQNTGGALSNSVFVGLRSDALLIGTGQNLTGSSQLIGVVANSSYNDTGTLAGLIGAEAECSNQNAAGTVTSVTCQNTQILSNAGTMTNVFLNSANVVSNSGTIGTLVDFLSNNISGISGIGTKYAFRGDDTGKIFQESGCFVAGSPTGGCKGAGTINIAGSIWTNGTQGVASKSCVVNTANAATGITLTITNGLITGTTTC
jgi:hypothetical protein